MQLTYYSEKVVQFPYIEDSTYALITATYEVT